MVMTMAMMVKAVVLKLPPYDIGSVAVEAHVGGEIATTKAETPVQAASEAAFGARRTATFMSHWCHGLVNCFGQQWYNLWLPI